MKSKKSPLGEDIRQKEIKLGPHRDHLKDGPPPGDKISIKIPCKIISKICSRIFSDVFFRDKIAISRGFLSENTLIVLNNKS